jgi:DNA (cytosine-5)-methyltransferase 1
VLDFSAPVGAAEELFVSLAANVDLVVAGPPCQGHSALNNRTRHDDDRNGLYMSVPRVARLLEPRVVVIENVPGVSRDRRQTLERSLAALQELGYTTSAFRVDLSQLGTPQTRKRHVTVAVRGAERRFEMPSTVGEPRSVGWAISDLDDREARAPFDKPSEMSADNRKRIDWLFDNNAYDLPNHLRPVCHQTDHSYKSMYGRLKWDEPAQTITSGFGSMGQGRFVHPRRRRTLTPHEAARLQFLPDAMRFESVTKRTELATMIGNVAPPALTMTVVQALAADGLL